MLHHLHIYKHAIMGGALLVLMSIAHQAHAQYFIYRGVLANDNTGAVIWNEDNFGVSGVSPSLSFSHYANDNTAQKQLRSNCIIKVNLGNLNVPNPGHAAKVSMAPFDIPNAGNDASILVNSAPWNVIFDNIPYGHWSVPKSQILVQNVAQSQSNTRAGKAAAAGMKVMVLNQASDVSVINGTKDNCSIQ